MWEQFTEIGTKKSWSCGHFGACPSLQIKFSCTALTAWASGLPQGFAPPGVSLLHSTSGLICITAPFSIYMFAFLMPSVFYIENAAGLC